MCDGFVFMHVGACWEIRYLTIFQMVEKPG